MSEQFCLRWNNHQSTLISVFENLLESGSLIDCTLCAEGQLLKAHKVVLSACSPTFESMLCIQEDKHPIIFLKDVRFIELKAMIDYMYKGEVNILQDQLDSFLKTAAALQIKGLTDQGGGGGDEPPAKKGPGRKTGMSDVAPESPLVGNAPLREGSMSPTRRRRRIPRRPSSAEDASADNSSCDIPPPATAPNVLPASTPNPSASDSSPAPRLSVKKTEPIDQPMITPKQEMLDEPAEDIEDLTLDDDDDYNDAMSDMSKPGTSFGAMAPGNTSQDFSQWQQMMGAADRSGQDEVFMAAQEAINNQTNTQDPPSKEDIPDFSDLANNFPEDLPEDPLGAETNITRDLAEHVSENDLDKTESSIQFFTGNRGKQLILYQGNKFCLHRKLASGETSWICSTKPCPARLRCSKDFTSVVKARLDHKHPPPEQKKLERAKVCNEAKRVALETLAGQPKSLIEAVISTENFESLSKEDVKMVRNNLYRLRRAKRKQQEEELGLSGTLSDDPGSLPDLDTSQSGLSFSSFRSDDEFGLE